MAKKQLLCLFALLLFSAPLTFSQTEVKTVHFERGKNNATVQGILRNKDHVHLYRLRANLGQKMRIQLITTDPQIWISLDRGTGNNRELIFAEVRGTETIELPANDLYNIGVFARNGLRTGRYTLKITIF